jgi:hypothetical protein
MGKSEAKTERKTAYHTTYEKLAVHWLNEALCRKSSSLLADSLVLRKPLLREAPKWS